MKNTVKVELVVLLSDFHVVEYLGVGYIKAYLESKGIETTIDTVKPEEIDALIAKVRENKISIVGFAAYSNTILSVLHACRKLKSALPYVHITLGGPQVASYSKKILEENVFIDSVIEGEGEFAFYDLASHIESAESLSGIKGLTYRDQNGEIIQNAPSEWIDNLDVLPFPDRTIFEQNKADFMFISGGRGCMGSCTFCSQSAVRPPKGAQRVRNRSPENIADEMELLYKKYNVSTFYMTEFTFDDPGIDGINKAFGVYREILKRKLPFSLQIYTRAEKVNERTVSHYRLGKEAGLDCIYLGVESGNAKDLKLFNKKASVQDNYKAIHLLSILDIHTICGFIFFNPYSDYERLRQNAWFLYNSGMGHALFLYMSRLEIFPQAAIIHRLKKDGLLSQDFDYKCDGYNYRFANPQIGILFNALKTKLDPTLYDVDNKLAVEEKILRRNHPRVYKKVIPLFSRLQEIRSERLRINHQVFMKLLDLSQKNAAEQELIDYLQQSQINKYDHEIMYIFVQIYKQKLMSGVN